MVTLLSRRKRYIFLPALFLALALFSGTGKSSATLPSAPQNAAQDKTGSRVQIQPPKKGQAPAPATPRPLSESTHNGLNGSWLSASPSLLGFDSLSLEMSVEEIGRMDGIYSVIVVRNGILVVERYFREASRTKPHNLKSASKSILSALIGIAIDKKLLGLDQPITDFIPLEKGDTPEKKKITVRHLLTMTSGLQSTSYQQYNSWIADGNWVENAMKQPLTSTPGTIFQYSTGNTHILSAILARAAGKSALDFAIEHLFSPLGITIWDWATDPQGINQGGNNLSLFPRDMARIGQLYLDNGTFGGEQMIPKWWIDESTRPGQPSDHEVYGDYGFLWYTHPGGRDAFTAVGFGGQYIYVSRPEECVIVVTSTLTSKGLEWEKQLFAIFHNGILKSLHPESRPLLRTALADSTGAISRAGAPETGRQKTSLLAETITRLNLRQKPDKNTPAVTTLETGEILRIVNQSGPWFQVRSNGHEGWVLADYIRIISSETSSVARLTTEEKPAANKREKAPDDPRTALQEAELRAARLQDLLQVSEAKLNQTNSALIQVEEMARDQEKVISSGKITLRNMELEREGLRNLVASLESSLQEKKGTEAGLQKKVADLEKRLHEGNQGFSEERKKLAEQIKEVNLKNQALTLQHSQLVARLEKSESAKKALAGELEAAKAQGDAAGKSHQKLQQELAAARDALNRDLIAQKLALEQETNNRKTAEEELVKLRALVAEKQSALVAGTETAAALQASLAGVQEEVKAQEKLTAKLQEEQKKLDQEKQALAQEHGQLVARFEKSESAKKALAGELEAAKTQGDAAGKSHRKLQQELAAARDALNRDLIAQKLALEQETNNRKTAEEELVKLRALVAEKQNALVAGTETAAALQASLAGVQEEVKAQEKLTAKLQEEQKKLDQEKQALAQEHSQLVARFEKSESAKKALAGELEAAKAQGDAAGKSHRKLQQELIAARDALNRDLIAQKLALEQETKNRKTAEEELVKLRALVAEKQSALVAGTETAAALQASLAGVQEEVKAQDKLTAQLQEEQKKLDREKQALAQEHSQLVARFEKSESAKKALAGELEAAKTQGDAADKSHQKLQQELAAARDALNRDLSAQKLALEQETKNRKTAEEELVKLRALSEKEQQDRKKTEQEVIVLNSRIAALQESLQSERIARNAAEQERSGLHGELIALRQAALAKKPVTPPGTASAAGTDQPAMTVKPQAPPERPTSRKIPDQAAPDYDGVNSFVTSWAASWSKQDVTRYLASYSLAFKSAEGLNHSAWTEQRKRRLARPSVISIQLERISTEKTGPDMARVSFDQRYRSDVYNDHVNKTLDLRWEKDQWKIVRETSAPIQ